MIPCQHMFSQHPICNIQALNLHFQSIIYLPSYNLDVIHFGYILHICEWVTG
ncbi:hypothetical protein HanPSC8_Chr06g0238741 [Helianthus annuus]|nr:hypothetical protein HanPSC8_Chr06g0238741 [Helianthus annuus]